MRRALASLIAVTILAAFTSCGRAPDWPWVDARQFYHLAPTPGVPVIRIPEADAPQLDGALEDACWKTAPEFHEFGYNTGMGLLDFPTSVRFVRNRRILWLALDFRIPPARDGKVPDKAMDSEMVEIWLDPGPTRHTFYQLMLKPDGELTCGWIPKSTLDKGIAVKTVRRADGWTAEVLVDIDVMSDFGSAPGPNIGFNIARNCAHGWASLAQVVGHVHKPLQFWTLDMTGALPEVAPSTVYRDPFKPGADVRAIARTLTQLSPQLEMSNQDRSWARMSISMDRLSRLLAQDQKDPWGRSPELAVATWRALALWRELGLAMVPTVADLMTQLADAPGGIYPATTWHEEAYISSFDHTPQPYSISVPKSYDPSRPIPLMLFLHGSGADHFGGGALFERYEQDLGVIQVRTKSRQCGWYDSLAMRDVLEVIDDVMSQYNVDPDRVYLTGYSAGAYGSLTLAATHPERFAAIAPIAGSLTGKSPDPLVSLPVLMVYGANDYAMHITEDTAVGPLRLRDVGAQLRVSMYPATGHGIAVAGYEDWLLRFRRQPVPETVACFTDPDNPAPARACWVSILALANPDGQAAVRAELGRVRAGETLAPGNGIVVQTANVSEFALDLGDVSKLLRRPPAQLVVDGQGVAVPHAPFARFKSEDNVWRAEGTSARPTPDATRYVAGGVGTLYEEGSALIVAPESLTAFAEKLSHRSPSGLNGSVSIPVRKDTTVTDDELRANHVMLVGGPTLNKVTARLMASEKDWPVPVESGAVVLDKKRSAPLAENIVAVVTFNPLNRERRMWVMLTERADAFTDESPLLKGQSRSRRAADIQVIDVKSNAVVDERLLDREWKLRGRGR